MTRYSTAKRQKSQDLLKTSFWGKSLLCVIPLQLSYCWLQNQSPKCIESMVRFVEMGQEPRATSLSTGLARATSTSRTYRLSAIWTGNLLLKKWWIPCQTDTLYIWWNQLPVICFPKNHLRWLLSSHRKKWCFLQKNQSKMRSHLERSRNSSLKKYCTWNSFSTTRA